MGPDAIILVFWTLSFKPLSSFAFIKRFFSSSSLSAIRLVSSAYLRLLIFRPTILIPPWDSLSLAFRLMYSACKLNKQGDNIQPRHTPFPILDQSIVTCPVLTIVSWPAYRVLVSMTCEIDIKWRNKQLLKSFARSTPVVQLICGFSLNLATLLCEALFWEHHPLPCQWINSQSEATLPDDT